jgi:hypothetical protein
MEAVGFNSFWGFSPSFKGTVIDPSKDDKEINVFLSECSDLRHILKSLTECITNESVR